MKPSTKIIKKDRNKVVDKKRAAIIRDMAEEYGYTEVWIRECVNGTYTGENATNIKKEYQKRYAEPYILK